MKKTTQLFASIIFMLLTTHVAFSQTEYQLDSIQKFDWDINVSNFIMTEREHFTYANGGTKPTFCINYIDNFTTSAFDWIPEFRSNKTYNEFNNIISIIGDSYDPVFDVWYIGDENDGTYYEYDASQNNTAIIYAWASPDPVFLFTYNSDNLVIIKTERFYDSILMGMHNLNQTLTSYNGLLKADEIYQVWHNSTSTWSDEEKTDFTYSGDLPVQEDIYFWFTNDWATQAFKRRLNTYTNDLLTEKVIQEWNNGVAVWENTERTTWAIDTNGNIQEILTFTWDTNTSDWINEKQELWFWSEAGAILSVEEENKLSINIYPNPTTDYFTISNVNENATIAMFDVFGKRVGNYNLEANQNSKIYTNQLGSGLYFLKISSDTGTISKKLIVK